MFFVKILQKFHSSALAQRLNASQRSKLDETLCLAELSCAPNRAIRFTVLFLSVFFCLLIGACAVNAENNGFDQFPQQLSVGAAPSAVFYVQKAGYYAVHGRPLPAENAVLVFEAEAIAILQGTPIDVTSNQTLSPVYTPQGSESLAVPTGQVFIRFREGDVAEAHRSAIAEAGYEIAQMLDYAPQAAWLNAESGSVADALAGIDKLRAIANVESVEPQMLMQRSLR
jgi:hypothetical protein